MTIKETLQNILFIIICIIMSCLPCAGEEGSDIDISGDLNVKWRHWNAGDNESNFLRRNGLNTFSDRFLNSINLRFGGAVGDGGRVKGNISGATGREFQGLATFSGTNISASFGDLHYSLDSVPLIGFNKMLRGITADMKDDSGLGAFVLLSSEKSEQESEEFLGANIKGPYQLRQGFILPNSEIVEIDGVVISPQHYKMDYPSGYITFDKPVDSVSRVRITYESELLFSQRSQTIEGAGLTKELSGGKFRASFAYLNQGVDRRLGNTIDTHSAVFDTGDLDPSGAFSLPHDHIQKYLETVTAYHGSDSITLERSPDTQFTSSHEYFIDYLNGSITINTGADRYPLFASGTDNITVSYSAYPPDSIEEIYAEELRGENQSVFTLEHWTVYSGSEIVSLYRDGAFIRQLEPDEDYRIDEGNNAVIVLDPLATPSFDTETYLSIDYESVSVATPERNEVENRMGGVALAYKDGNGISASASWARSSADVGSKSVNIVGEIAGIIDPASGNTFPLSNLVIPGSLKVYFNDHSSFFSLQPRISQSYHTIDSLSTGGHTVTSIVFDNPPPPGTVVFVDYKYIARPPERDMISGNAFSLDLSIDRPGFSFDSSILDKSTLFAPMNSLNDMETLRWNSSLSTKIGRKTALGLGARIRRTARDLAGGGEDVFGRFSSDVDYTHNDSLSFNYSFYTENQDRASAYATGVDNLYHSFAASYHTDRKLKNIDLALSRLDSNAGDNDEIDREFITYDISLVIEPLDGLEFSSNQSLKRMDSLVTLFATSPAALAGRDTSLRSYDLSYKPSAGVHFDASLDIQDITDTGGDYSTHSIENTKLLYSRSHASRTVPDKIVVSYNRKDSPDTVQGFYSIISANASFIEEINRTLSARLNHNTVSSSFHIKPSSKSTTNGIGLTFNNEPWMSSLTLRKGRRHYSTAGRSSDDSLHRQAFIRFQPALTQVSLNWSRNDTGDLSSASSYSLNYFRNLNSSSSLTCSFSKTSNQYDTSDNTWRKWKLSFRSKFKVNYSLDLSVEYQDYSANSGASDFNGLLMQTEFNAEL